MLLSPGFRLCWLTVEHVYFNNPGVEGVIHDAAVSCVKGSELNCICSVMTHAQLNCNCSILTHAQLTCNCSFVTHAQQTCLDPPTPNLS